MSGDTIEFRFEALYGGTVMERRARVPRHIPGDESDGTYPAQDVWEKIDPGEAVTIELEGEMYFQSSNDPMAWEWRPGRIKIDCRYLVAATML